MLPPPSLSQNPTGREREKKIRPTGARNGRKPTDMSIDFASRYGPTVATVRPRPTDDWANCRALFKIAYRYGLRCATNRKSLGGYGMVECCGWVRAGFGTISSCVVNNAVDIPDMFASALKRKCSTEFLRVKFC